MIVDTSALLASFDTDEPDHDAVSRVIDAATEPLVVPPYVVAALDYLVGSRLGVAAEMAVLTELAGGAWDLAAFGAEDLAGGHLGHRALRGPVDRRRRRVERGARSTLPDPGHRDP